MSVTSVKRIGNGRRASSKLGQTTYDVPFLVWCSTATDDATVILAHASIPAIGATYNFDGHADATAVCVGHELTNMAEDRGSRHWLVVAEFSQTSDTGAAAGNPLSRAARYKTSFAQFTRVMERDLDNKPVVNAAGLRFDEPLEVDDARPILHVMKNIGAMQFGFWAQKLFDYKDAVNSDTFLYWPPKTVKVVNMDIGEMEKWQTTYYHPLTIDFAFNRDGWQPKIANMSRKAIDLFNGNAVYDIEDADGHRLIDPIFIKPDGTEEGGGKSATPNYIDFKAYKELPFAFFVTSLGISF